MKYSEYLIKTQKETPNKVESINGDLLIRGNFVDQVMAGVYTYLPLGVRVLDKISSIIKDEMNTAGGVELFMPTLQPMESWKKTGRWETEDNLYRFTSYYSKTDLVLGPTHEEVVMPLMKKFINSYRDLPKYVYQIQNKFRDEKRAKSGILRGREFLMKDLYSFHTDQADLDRYYEIMKQSYSNIFNRCGIGEQTYLTFASGGSFSKFSHEFQTITDSGEDIIYLCSKCRVAINKEVIKIQPNCPDCGSNNLETVKAVEVGNIFKNKDKYTKVFDVNFTDESGKNKTVLTGCYGIGLGRLMGAVVEVCHDERGIIWPASIAPFDIQIVTLGDKEVVKTAEKVYKDLIAHGYEVLWDDRDESAGQKLADADLIGCPLRLIISKKTLDNDSVELKLRNSDKSQISRIDSLNQSVSEILNAK